MAAIRKSKKQMTMTTADIIGVYANWNVRSASMYAIALLPPTASFAYWMLTVDGKPVFMSQSQALTEAEAAKWRDQLRAPVGTPARDKAEAALVALRRQAARR